MFISHKNNVIQHIRDQEWNCRRMSKGMTMPEYWAWEETIKDSDGVPDYSGETGYTIVECKDEDVEERLGQLGDYVSNTLEGTTYNIKYYSSKKDTEEIKDVVGNSHDPKQYVQSHFVPDDDAKDARLLANEWVQIRAERDRLLGQTDWMMLSDTGTVSAAWKNYRKALREIPQSQDSVKTFADIDWPVKPSS